MFKSKKKKRRLARIPGDRLLIRATVRTDTGCIRSNNEDCAGFLFLDGSSTDFFAILADGMGGYERGEEASATMVRTAFEDGSRTAGRRPRRWLAELFARANNCIHARALQLDAVMGTTCSMLLIRNRKVYCAHVGDSRIYLLAGGTLQQLTRDHTYVNELVHRGRITAAEATVHPQRNLLVKAIGTAPHVTPDVFRVKDPVRAGSRFLLCSDGLYDLVPDSEIRRLMAAGPLREIAPALVARAREYGGYDNITAVIVEINEKTDMSQL
jgi:protein phosphatase